MLPADAETRLEARLWDRFFDLHVHDPMQRIVFDKLRPADKRDPLAVAEAERRLAVAYGMIEDRMKQRTWAIGDQFSIADCAAAPALFYAGIIVPFGAEQAALRGYFERLVQRPSFARVLNEAKPFFPYFPFRDRMPDRFL